MRAISLIAAGLCLATASIHAGEVSLTPEQRELRQLLLQMPEVPDVERELMEQAIRLYPLASVSAEQAEMLDLLKQMDLPEQERQLMQQAILGQSLQPQDEALQVCALPVSSSGDTCKRA